ncbi:MAG: acyl-CoA dehydrogenase family protein [Acidimicrobiia bacterium]|nr:acyl-CoA dehydrogenase family protein [Acidimicrobiia bacterium]
MNLHFSPEDEAFRAEVRDWLETNLTGELAGARGLGGSGREHEHHDLRLAWERRLGEAGWIGLAWPEEAGGRGASLVRQVIFAEEYARADAPARVNHMGEHLLGPTLLAFGTEAQKERFLPPILRGEELWCQGYSEPDAGSDLANVQTVAVRDGDEWVITGQKVWTSLAQWADWCFVLARTDRTAPRHRGLSYLLCPMHQDGVEIRPIVQLTGTSEFNEVFFDGARTAADSVVGEVNDGWRVALATLAFERGVSTLAQQIGFGRELDAVVAAARARGLVADPVVRSRLVTTWIGLRLLRFNALRTMSGEGEPGPEASISKLAWATWHRALGRLAVDVLGPTVELPQHDRLRRLFLFTTADTIYGGSNQIQRNLLAERVLGLPKEPA